MSVRSPAAASGGRGRHGTSRRPPPWRGLQLLASFILAAACDTGAEPTDIVLASTTSTEDSGLLDVLLPAFSEADGGTRVRLVAVGSGQALELGRRGDADVLLVHSPDAEAAFMQAGHGRARLPVMYTDFVLVGPPADPAAVEAADDVAEVMRRIGSGGHLFVSRGDDSGTHHRELELWRAAGWTDPPGSPHRLEAGQGMGETLALASERGGYTLADRATWLARSEGLALALLYEGDPRLMNPYTVITVTNAANPEGADRFATWLTSAEAAAVVDTFATDRFGHPLFRTGAPPAAAAR